jgi:ankyrin repeat protein
MSLPELLPTEIMVSILVQLSVRDIIALTRSSVTLSGYGWNWTMWSIKAEEAFQFPRKLFHATDSPNPRWRYREVRYYYQHPNRALLRAAKTNNFELLNWAMTAGASLLELAVRRAAVKGHLDMITLIYPLMLPLGNRWINWKSPHNPLSQAALGGHRDVFTYLLDIKGAMDYCNLILAINNAAWGGHQPLLEFLQTLRPIHRFHGVYSHELHVSMNCDFYTPKSLFSSALIRAASRGHLHVVKYILSHGVDQFNRTHVSRALHQAIDNGHGDVARYLLSIGASGLGRALTRATRHDRHDLIRDIIPRLVARTDFLIHVDRAFVEACQQGHINSVMELWSYGASTRVLGSGIREAIKWGHVEVLRTLIEQDDRQLITPEDLNSALSGAAYAGNLECVKLLIDYGANRLDLALSVSLVMHQFDVARFIIHWGHTKNVWSSDNLNGILDLVASTGSLELLQEVISYGSLDINAAATRALQSGHWEVLSYLIELGESETPLECERRSFLESLERSLFDILVQFNWYNSAGYYVLIDRYEKAVSIYQQIQAKLAVKTTLS